MPDSSCAKPSCMRNTSVAQESTHAASIGSSTPSSFAANSFSCSSAFASRCPSSLSASLSLIRPRDVRSFSRSASLFETFWISTTHLSAWRRRCATLSTSSLPCSLRVGGTNSCRRLSNIAVISARISPRSSARIVSLRAAIAASSTTDRRQKDTTAANMALSSCPPNSRVFRAAVTRCLESIAVGSFVSVTVVRNR